MFLIEQQGGECDSLAIRETSGTVLSKPLIKLSNTMLSQFALAKSCTTYLIVQPSDLALNLLKSYLFI
jgi:hypothetical protein